MFSVLLNGFFAFLLAQYPSIPPKTRPQLPSKPTTVTPHEAHYVIRLKKKQEGGDIKDITGQMQLSYRWLGGRFFFDQSSTLTISYVQEEEKDEYTTKITSCEDENHQNYNFCVTFIQNKQEIGVLQGDARSVLGQTPFVRYSSPEVKTVPLPQNVLFPIHYLNRILQAIEKESTTKVLSNLWVFDGSYEHMGPSNLNVILNPTKASVEADQPLLLPLDKAWNVQVASFIKSPDKDLENDEPTAEWSQVILPSGVMTSMTIPYGEGLVLEVVLKKIIFFKAT